MSRPWDREEIDWARECADAGDTVEDIAEMSGRTVDDVLRNAPRRSRLTAHERQVLQLYVAGTTIRDIGRALKPTSNRPDSLAHCYIRRLRAKGYPLPARHPGRSPDAEARRHG